MTDLKEALSELDLKGAMREAFGKCPQCGRKAESGDWLKWCSKWKVCKWVAPK